MKTALKTGLIAGLLLLAGCYYDPAYVRSDGYYGDAYYGTDDGYYDGYYSGSYYSPAYYGPGYYSPYYWGPAVGLGIYYSDYGHHGHWYGGHHGNWGGHGHGNWNGHGNWSRGSGGYHGTHTR
jgi:hypothetical protein